MGLPLFISLLIFLDLAVIIFYVVYLLFRKSTPILDRLVTINKSAPSEAPAPEGSSPARARVESLLMPLAEFAPKSPREVGRTRKMLFRAGYRGKAAVPMFYGLKVAAALLMPLILYLILNFVGDMPWNQRFGLMAIGLLVGYVLPGLVVLARIRGRQDAIQRALPDALDLMVVCVEAGLGLDQSILRVSEELQYIAPEISDELGLVTLEMRAGKARVDALRNMAARTGIQDVSSLVAMLIQTDRFGTSIAQSLRVHSDAMRVKRRQRAEEAASKVPVKLVFPIFFFIFPAIFIVTLAPGLLQFVQSFWPTIQ